MNMKQTILILGGILLLANIIAGMMLSSYQWANVGYTSLVICITTCFLLASCQNRMKDGFKPALILLYMIIGIVQFILLALMPAILTDNWYLITSLILFVFDVIVLILAKQLSIKNL